MRLFSARKRFAHFCEEKTFRIKLNVRKCGGQILTCKETCWLKVKQRNTECFCVRFYIGYGSKLSLAKQGNVIWLHRDENTLESCLFKNFIVEELVYPTGSCPN